MKAVLNIQPLPCGGCVQKIKNHLSQEQAIRLVDVFPQLRKVRVDYDSNQVTLSQISELMAQIGYPVSESIEI